MRGFLFRAFRNTYGFLFATVLILVLTGLGHDIISKSLAGFALIMSVNLALCFIREKSNSLWDCILCHLAYNSTLNLLTWTEMIYRR